jgi:CBS domain-containing protein
VLRSEWGRGLTVTPARADDSRTAEPPEPALYGGGEFGYTVLPFRDARNECPMPDRRAKEVSMKTLKQLLQGKGGDVHSIGPDARVYDALKLMAEKDVGALVVMEAGRLVGIVSERDYARKVILQGKSSHDIPVREIMTGKLVTVQPGQTVEECMTLMTGHRVRHLPVTEAGLLIGVLSIGDLVKEVIADQEQTIKQLESYIHS